MSDERSPELRELAQRLFAAGRAERPSPALERRMLLIEPSHMERAGAPPASELAASRARRIGSARSSWGRWVALAALLAGATGLWLQLRAPVRPLSISAETVGPVASSPEPARPDPAERATSAPGPAPAATGESSAAPVLQAPRPRPARALERMPPPAPTPRATEDTSERGAEVEPAPAVAPASAAEPRRAPALTLLDEIELLKRARSALRAGDGAGALVLLDRHERERAGDSLTAEATLLRIEVLAALGRKPAASELAQRFVRSNPNHALSDRARSFIGGTPQVP
jgi:hypothetical protein